MDPMRWRGELTRAAQRARSSIVSAPPMSNDSPQLRMGILGIVVVSLFAALFARLWFLQVMDADEYRDAVTANSIRVVQEEAPRGRILDRNGRIIVDNEVARVVTINPFELEEAEDPDAIVLRLARELTAAGIPTKVADIEEDLEDPQYSRFDPIPVATGVPEELEVFLAERADEFPSVAVTRQWVRSYPNGRLAAHVVGYVGRINDEELADKEASGPEDKPYLVSSQIGKSGIELVYEDQLRGVPGQRTIEVDVENEPVRTVDYVPPVRGNDVQLAIDVDVQSKAEQALREQLDAVRGDIDSTTRIKKAPAGSTVVLDPTNGDVIAMASYPDYDPNEFVNGISQRRYRELQGDDPTTNPLINRAIQGEYAPGSTFKLVTAYAAVTDGLITPDEVVNDGGTYRIEGCSADKCTRQNAGGKPHGPVDLAESLTVSSDVYYYRLGDQYWIQRDEYGDGIQEAARKFGFAEKTGIELPFERPGAVPTPDDVEGEWRSGDNVNMAIGQGFVTVTPLQLANAYATFAADGVRHEPRVVLRVLAPMDDPKVPGPVVSENDPVVAEEVPMPVEVWDPIHAGLAGVATSSSPRGTAYDVFLGFDFDRFGVVSKTGTAQVAKKADTSVFAAYGPDPEPRYVVASILEESGFGSQAAAPVARRVFEQVSGQPDSLPEEIAALGAATD